MDDADKILFLEYARLKAEAAVIKDRTDVLSALLLEKMVAIDGEDTKIETNIGNFSVKKTKTWTYPGTIVQAEEDLKVAKKTAQQVGDAKATTELSLYFKRKDSPQV